MSKIVRLSILGAGTVGGGVLTLLRENADLLQAQTGKRFEVRHVLVRDPNKPRAVARLAQTADDRPSARAVCDPKVHIVLELMGGLEPARMLIRDALQAGKHVITANKWVMAVSGDELLAAWRGSAERAPAVRGERRRQPAHPERAARRTGGQPHRARGRHRQQHYELHPARDGARPRRGRTCREPPTRTPYAKRKRTATPKPTPPAMWTATTRNTRPPSSRGWRSCSMCRWRASTARGLRASAGATCCGRGG
jgi:hypothetical protein